MEEISGTRALLRIAMALPMVERSYAIIRFLILRVKLLAVMDLLLPAKGRILDVGCGFGLWTAYFGQVAPERQILGVDRSEKRVEMARQVVARVGVHASFQAADIREAHTEGLFDAAYVLDVLHHIPRADQKSVLLKLRELLAPGGVLLIKDITTEPWYGLKFTEILDRVMVGFDEELAYRHHREWQTLLEEMGFSVRTVRVPDILPYPHVILVAHKPHQ